jgi:hypothetical protein
VLAIATYATRAYFYAWTSVLRHIATAASHHSDACFIVVTDQSEESKAAVETAKSELPEGWKVIARHMPLDDSVGEKYKQESQMRIAQMQGVAFSIARRIRAKCLWSVESDMLVGAESLRVAEWALQMPQADGSPYYGSYQNPIAMDFEEKERKLPPRLKAALETCRARLKDCKDAKLGEREGKRLGRLMERVRRCPPDGNIWEVTAKHGWRRRGWLDFAYPAIGRGAIVPSDWCGLGCTLLSGKALSLATFEGYQGNGTQDLYLCWNRWHPAGLRIAAITHAVCDHVKRKSPDAPVDQPEITHYRAYHQPDGEYRGHLRVTQQPWTPC